MAFVLQGPVKFRGGMDPEGHREYKVTYKVKTLSNQDGPQQAMVTPGLPVLGATYAYGGEIDIWAWRQPQIEVEPVPGNKEGDFPKIWYVTVTFSTKSRRIDQERPNSAGPVSDPLAEPQKVSGDFSDYTEEGQFDRHLNPIQTSSFEPIHGPQNEWDCCRPSIMIEQNVADLQLDLLCKMKDTVNSTPLWGFPVRSIKFKPRPWQKNYGKGSSYYYVRRLLFELNVRPDTTSRVATFSVTNGSPSVTATGLAFGQTDVGRVISGSGIPVGATIVSVSASGVATMSANATSTVASAGVLFAHSGGVVGNWDRDIVDEGTKVVRGYWDTSVTPFDYVPDFGADPTNPMDFIHYQDPKGNFCSVILDGHGDVYDSTVDTAPGKIHIEKYPESNFTALNIPLVF